MTTDPIPVAKSSSGAPSPMDGGKLPENVQVVVADWANFFQELAMIARKMNDELAPVIQRARRNRCPPPHIEE